MRSSSELVNLYPVVCMESNCCAFNFLGLPNLSFCKLFTETFNGEVMRISLVFFFVQRHRITTSIMIMRRKSRDGCGGMAEGSTYPRSRSDRSWLLVSLRGSPLPSAATASSSSNGGMMNKSRRLFLDFRLVPTFEAFTGPVVSALMVDEDVVDEIG